MGGGGGGGGVASITLTYLRLMSVEYKLQDLSQGQLVSGVYKGVVDKHTVVGERILQLGVG